MPAPASTCLPVRSNWTTTDSLTREWLLCLSRGFRCACVGRVQGRPGLAPPVRRDPLPGTHCRICSACWSLLLPVLLLSTCVLAPTSCARHLPSVRADLGCPHVECACVCIANAHRWVNGRRLRLSTRSCSPAKGALLCVFLLINASRLHARPLSTRLECVLAVCQLPIACSFVFKCNASVLTPTTLALCQILCASPLQRQRRRLAGSARVHRGAVQARAGALPSVPSFPNPAPRPRVVSRCCFSRSDTC